MKWLNFTAQELSCRKIFYGCNSPLFKDACGAEVLTATDGALKANQCLVKSMLFIKPACVSNESVSELG